MLNFFKDSPNTQFNINTVKTSLSLFFFFKIHSIQKNERSSNGGMPCIRLTLPVIVMINYGQSSKHTHTHMYTHTFAHTCTQAEKIFKDLKALE